MKKNLSQPSTETATSSAANYALDMLKSYAFSNSAALTRDPYSYFYKESPNDLEQAPLPYGSSSSGSIQTSSASKSSASGSIHTSSTSSSSNSATSTGPGGDTTVYWFRNRPVLNWCRRKLNMLCNRARDVFIVLYIRLCAGVMYIVESISQGFYYCLGRIVNPIQSARDVHTYFVTELFTSEGQPQVNCSYYCYWRYCCRRRSIVCHLIFGISTISSCRRCYLLITTTIISNELLSTPSTVYSS